MMRSPFVRTTTTALAIGLFVAPAHAQTVYRARQFADSTGTIAALELDGKFAGYLTDFEGGNVVGEVKSEPLGGDYLVKKHIGNVKYEEISFKCGTGMSKALYDWIDTGFDQTHNQGGKGRKSGAIILADYDYNEFSRIEFSNALLTELGMPALDAASKDAAKMTLKFKPEYTRKQLSSGRTIPPSYKIDGKKQKQWLPANFRLKIDGLDAPASRVSKVDAFTIKQSAVTAPDGTTRDGTVVGSVVEVSNLAVSLPESEGDGFFAWHEDFVVKGNNGDDAERSGTLEFLNADESSVLFSLTFKNLGVFKVAPDKMEAGAEGIRRIKAEMYCEDVRFSYSPSATFGFMLYLQDPTKSPLKWAAADNGVRAN